MLNPGRHELARRQRRKGAVKYLVRQDEIINNINYNYFTSFSNTKLSTDVSISDIVTKDIVIDLAFAVSPFGHPRFLGSPRYSIYITA